MMNDTEFEMVWSQLACTLRIVIAGEQFKDKSMWNDSFQDVYKICIAYPRPLHEKLYQRLSNLLQEHCSGVFQCINEDPEAMVEIYSRRWKLFSKSAENLNLLFRYFNQLFVTTTKTRDPDFIQIQDPSMSAYKQIEQLALEIWKNIIIEPLHLQLSEKVLSEINNLRRNPTQTIQSDANVIPKSFVQVDRCSKKDKLKFYETGFECHFLSQTDAYYKDLARQLLDTSTCSQYMKKVLGLLTNEEMRSKEYLDESSFRKAAKCCQQRLIFDHISFLQDGCVQMIADERNDDLNHMYMLLRSDATYLRYMSEQLLNHISSRGIAKMSLISYDNIQQAAEQFVEGILEIHSESKESIKELFHDDTIFTSAADRAITVVVNHKYDPDRATRCSELVCKFCDLVLKRAQKAKDNTRPEEAAKKLDDAITVFRYIEDKDIFQRFYSRTLAKRLLNQSSSMDMEMEMIKELRNVCGYEFISKLQCMYNDVRTSVTHTKTFQEELAARGEPCDYPQLNVNILQTGSWPLQEPQTTFNLPHVLTRSFSEFNNYYKSKNKGKNLKWLHHLSSAEVKMQITNKTYHVNMSTFQLSILLLFNDVDKLTVSEVSRSTALPAKELQTNLNALLQADILKCDVDISKELREEASVVINTNFQHRRTRFRVSVPQSHKEQQVEATKTRASVEIDRKMYLRAAITRIMKGQKEASLNTLVQEVIQQAKTRFMPNVSMIKQAIDYLIDKAYLQHHPSKKDIYQYVA